jgi:hypothetical protein
MLVTGCTWSNSLYQARQLSGSAAKAEREERTFDAGSLWGQVAVKAESAYVRSPGGRDGAEALWLRGRALARLGDCPVAIPLLERARFAAVGGDWQEELMLELGRCRVVARDADGALATLEPLLASPDADVRRSARLLAGRALADAGRWAEAAERLADDRSTGGRWALAIALAELGRGDEALEEVGPRLAAQDSSADWGRLLRALAREDLGTADRLVATLGAYPRLSDTVRARWLLATATGVRASDPEEARQRLEAVLAFGPTPSASTARSMLAEQVVERVVDAGSLRRALDDLRPYARGDVATAYFVTRYSTLGEQLLADADSIVPGTEQGDLAMWFAAGLARDSLGSAALADWFLRRIETGWPGSPYLPKALLARIRLLPDSAAAIRARLGSYQQSEYLAYLRGEESARFAALEDSLAFYLDGRWARRAATTGGGRGDVQ